RPRMTLPPRSTRRRIAHIAGIGGDVRCVALHGSPAIEAAVESLVEEISLVVPGQFGLSMTVTFEHRFVEKTVRSILVDVDLKCLAILLQQIAKDANMRYRNVPVRLTEQAEDRAIDFGEDLGERLRIIRSDVEFLLRPCAVPADRC